MSGRITGYKIGNQVWHPSDVIIVREGDAVMTPRDALEWITDHFFHADHASADMQCDMVRYSPVTIAAARALRELGGTTYAMEKILAQEGQQ